MFLWCDVAKKNAEYKEMQQISAFGGTLPAYSQNSLSATSYCM